jgi:mannose/cellobiose epimerase-like protein (N-acyl-D-glucosamine 2-epimerase family)
MSIGAAAVRDGFDWQYGGIYETGLPVTGPTSTLKVWWVQAESMLALWKLHQHYGRGHGQLEATAAGAVDAGGAGGDRQYLRALATTASFTLQHLTDTAGGGEQFWQVSQKGPCFTCCVLAATILLIGRIVAADSPHLNTNW